MKLIPLLIVLIILFSCSQKKESIAEAKLKPASEYFPKEKTKVLVVGTFHFDYPGLDVNKTADEDKIDVLVEPRSQK